MFNDYGAPTGYDQMQPNLDVPNYSRPGQPGRPPSTPLQSAITGGRSEYPTDPTMVAWRQRNHQAGPEKLGDRQHWSTQPHNDPNLPQNGGGFLNPAATGQIAPLSLPAQPMPSVQQQGQYRDQLSGFDMGKLNDPNHNTIKYQAARVFQNFAPSTESMPAVLAALRQAGLNVDQTSKDKFDFHDGYGPIDVGYAFGDPNAAHHWQWLNEPQGGAPPSPLQHAIMGRPQQNDPDQLLMQLLQQSYQS